MNELEQCFIGKHPLDCFTPTVFSVQHKFEHTLKDEHSWAHKPRQNRIMSNANFIVLYPSGVDNLHCLSKFSKFHRLSSMWWRTFVLNATLTFKFIRFHRNFENAADWHKNFKDSIGFYLRGGNYNKSFDVDLRIRLFWSITL